MHLIILKIERGMILSMKKKIIITVLAILLIGISTACATDTSVEDYLALTARFREFSEETELTITSETTFELLAVDGAVLNSESKQVQVDGMNEAMQIMRAFDERGRPFSEIEFIVIDDMGYVSMDYFFSLIIDSLELDDEYMEALGITEDDLSQESILGGRYTHLQLSDEMLSEMLEDIQEQSGSRDGLYGAFSEEALEEYLSYNDGVFRIEIEGESVRDYIEPTLEATSLDDVEIVLADMQMLVDIDADLVATLEDDFGWWLLGADLEDARLVIELEELCESTYQQYVELFIPEHVSITQTATIAIGESSPISAPNLYITETELTERMTNWFADLMLAMLQFPELPVDEVTDEPPHEVAQLEPYILVSESGEEVIVAVISGARIVTMDHDGIRVNSGGAIEVYYELVADYSFLDIVDVFEESLNWMMEMDDFTIEIFPIELNTDETAFFTRFIMDFSGVNVTVLTIGQDLPNSDYVLITEIMLDESIWTQEYTEILAQLSIHFGVDLMIALTAT